MLPVVAPANYPETTIKIVKSGDSRIRRLYYIAKTQQFVHFCSKFTLIYCHFNSSSLAMP